MADAENHPAPGRGLLLAAPSSGAGKTLVTLALLRGLRRAGHPVRGAKSGPDYIDPRFHEAASGAPCLNLDAWAMAPARLGSLAAGPGLLLVEGAMGLFDAAMDGRGSAAALARTLGLPVVLVVDAARMGQSVAALVAGFANHDPDLPLAGVILNRVGSPRHAALLRAALARRGPPVLGALPRLPALAMPARHLGLVQAEEQPDLEALIDRAAEAASGAIDLDALAALAAPLPRPAHTPGIPPPGQRIAVARDRAFGFAYPHLLDDWRRAGAEIRPFSPLADDPVPQADAVYLPGGYPELHAGRLAAAGQFLESLRRHAADGTVIWGECGGFMALGRAIIDADGRSHAMAGLLPLVTSFAERRLHLGYRHLSCADGPLRGAWAGHEFHYATVLEQQGPPLFQARPAGSETPHPEGLLLGRVMGSFAHVIDRGAAAPSQTGAQGLSAPP